MMIEVFKTNVKETEQAKRIVTVCYSIFQATK